MAYSKIGKTNGAVSNRVSLIKWFVFGGMSLILLCVMPFVFSSSEAVADPVLDRNRAQEEQVDELASIVLILRERLMGATGKLDVVDPNLYADLVQHLRERSEKITDAEVVPCATEVFSKADECAATLEKMQTELNAKLKALAADLRLPPEVKIVHDKLNGPFDRELELMEAKLQNQTMRTEISFFAEKAYEIVMETRQRLGLDKAAVRR